MYSSKKDILSAFVNSATYEPIDPIQALISSTKREIRCLASEIVICVLLNGQASGEEIDAYLNELLKQSQSKVNLTWFSKPNRSFTIITRKPRICLNITIFVI